MELLETTSAAAKDVMGSRPDESWKCHSPQTSMKNCARCKRENKLWAMVDSIDLLLEELQSMNEEIEEPQS